MLYSLQNLTNFDVLKAWALYVIIFLGHQNLDKMCVKRKSMTTSSVAHLVGIASTHLVKKYVAVKIPFMLPRRDNIYLSYEI